MTPGRHLWMPLALVLTMAAVPAHAETIRVTISKLVFQPANITAKVGDTIEWVNEDAFAHTATVKGSWEVMLPPKSVTSQKLDRAESVAYYCRFHPNMKGQLTVTAP